MESGSDRGDSMPSIEKIQLNGINYDLNDARLNDYESLLATISATANGAATAANLIESEVKSVEPIELPYYIIGAYKPDGEYSSNYKYAISTDPNHKLIFPVDIRLTCANGYAFAIQLYDEEGNFVSTVRWLTNPYIVKAGNIFTVSLRVNPLDSTLIADIDTYKTKLLRNSIITGVENQLNELENQIYDTEGQITEVRTQITTNSMCRNSDGVIVSQTGWNRTDYIDVHNKSRFKLETSLDACCFYDKNKVFISSMSSGTGNDWNNFPNSAYYMMLSGRAADFENLVISVYGSSFRAEIFDTISKYFVDFADNKYLNTSAPLQNVLGVTRFPNNLIIPEECVNNEYINFQTGTTVVSSTYFRTDYIPITAGTSYKANKGRNYAFYNSSKEYISGASGTSIQSGITAPTNAAYIRFTINKTSDEIDNPYMLYFTDVASFNLETQIDGVIISSRPWCYGKTINWIGDSIVDGEDFDEVVCTALGLTKLTTDGVNGGINGSTIALKDDGTNGRHALCLRYSDMPENADIIAVSCGTNDFQYAWCPIGTLDDADDGTSDTTLYGALKHLCKGLIDRYPQKLIFFTTPIKRAQAFADGAGGTYTADNVMTTPFSKNKYSKTLGDYADIIKEVCGYYSIPVLDMYRESLLNPHITSQQDMFDNVYTHPNATGQKIMARRVVGWIMQLGYLIN